MRAQWDDKERAWASIALVEGLTAKRFYQLLTHYGDILSVYEQAPKQARDLLFLPKRVAEALKSIHKDAPYFFKQLEKQNINLVTRLSSDYPRLLAQIYDPPPVLFYRGRLELFNRDAVAVVGSRKASRYGLDMAARIAGGLAQSGVTVVSGMARGIDTGAHQAALDAGGSTIAVLGCGIDICYPPENARIKAQIEQRGLIVSEYGPGTPPLAAHFPIRNRIISGLCKGVVLVEAAPKSGAMITANTALEQGREVFAVPGSPIAINSDGPNRLIRDGSGLVTCAQDVLDALGLAHAMDRPPDAAEYLLPELDLFEGKVVSLLTTEELSFDELSIQTGFDSRQLNCVLTMLELRGIIKKLPGNQYGL